MLDLLMQCTVILAAGILTAVISGIIGAICAEIRTERFWARKMERVLDPAELMGDEK